MKWMLLYLFPVISICQDFSFAAEDLEYSAPEELELDESAFGFRLDLNRIGASELKHLKWLTEEQIENFLQYRKLLGPFSAKEELRAVPGFDEATLIKMMEWIQLGQSSSIKGSPERSFFTRWSTTLPLKKGYHYPPKYIGSPYYLSHNFRYKIPGKISFGFGLEKDPGERYIDSYNIHFTVEDVTKVVKTIVAGDFIIQMGQGLITKGGFGGSFSLNPSMIVRSGTTFRPITGLSEGIFQRGLGITMPIRSDWDISLFISHRNRDSNRLYSSIGTSGLHRTLSEVAYKRAVGHSSGGFILKRKLDHGHIHWNFLMHHFNIALNPISRPYSQYRFSGNSLLNSSIDFSYLWKGLRIAGEWAIDGQLGSAFLTTLQFSPDKKFDLGLSYRNYRLAYQSFESDGFGKNSGTTNEQGLFILAVYKPVKQIEVAGFFDQRIYPWLKYNVHAPSIGQSGRLRITFTKRNSLQLYGEYYYDFSEQNGTKGLENTVLSRFRLATSFHISPSLEWRSRFESGYASISKGNLIFHDLLINPGKFPLNFKLRYAIFDTDGYDMRFYAYEHHLKNTYSMPAYFGNGHRGYLYMAYSRKKISLEAKTAYTFKSGREPFGSGNEAITSNHRWDIFSQIIYRW
jgi:hypothetical protein